MIDRHKKNNVYPCKPQFYYIKVEFKGVKIIWACFRNAAIPTLYLLYMSHAMVKGAFRTYADGESPDHLAHIILHMCVVSSEMLLSIYRVIRCYRYYRKQ